MLKRIKRLKKKMKALRDYLKYDGKITHLTMSQINYGGVLKGKRIVVTVELLSNNANKIIVVMPNHQQVEFHGVSKV